MIARDLSVSLHKCSILVVDDDPHVLTTLAQLLKGEFDVLTADSAETAQQRFAERDIDLILADQNLPGMSGVQLLEWVRERSPRTVRLMMTGMAKLEDAVQAINCGQVYSFLFKPWRAEHLLQNLRNAARTFLLEQSHEELLQELRSLNTD